MIPPAVSDADLVASLDHWILLPDESLPPTLVESWAQAAAAERFPDGTAAARVAELLVDLATDQVPAHAWRMLFLVDLSLGATLWTISFIEPRSDEMLPGLVSGDGPSQFGGGLQPFSYNGTAGICSVSYDVDPQSPSDERSIIATARAALTRDLPGLGRVTLVAEAVTGLLDCLAISTAPLQYLLTSDPLAALVADTQTPPGDRPGRPSEASAPEPGSH